MKRDKISIVSLAVLIVSYFLVQLYGNNTIETARKDRNGTVGEITSEKMIRQDFDFRDGEIEYILLEFATYGRVNNSTVFVSMEQEGKVVQEWEIQCNLLTNNSFYPLRLNGKNSSFSLILTSDAVEGNGITVYLCDSEENEFFINGVAQKGKQLNYKIQYRKSFVESVVNIVLLLILLTVCITYVVFGVKNIERSFLLIWILLTICYTISAPIFNVPDEYNHFYRALEVSEGHLISDYDVETNSGGRVLPIDVDLKKMGANWKSYHENANTYFSDSNQDFIRFSNTALYSPLSYAPQAIGIAIARIFTSNIAAAAYSGRVINWLLTTVLLFYSIKLMPCGYKELIVLIALMPMNLQESFSLATDGMVVALTLFIISYVLHIRYSAETKLKWYQIALIYYLGISISLYKIVYLPFCLVFLLIPGRCFSKGYKWLHGTFLVIITVVLSIVWMRYASQFLTHVGTDSTIQLRYLLSHPIEYILIVLRTYLRQADTLLLTMIGSSMANLNVPTAGVFVLMYAGLFILKCGRHEKDHLNRDKDDRIVFLSVVLLLLILIPTSLYIQWTAIYSKTVQGLQGRYYIPLILPLVLVIASQLSIKTTLSKIENEISYASRWIVVLTNACACISLLFAFA